MDHIAKSLSMIELNANMQIGQSERILEKSTCYLAKHIATQIKSRATDTIYMVNALKELTKNK